MPSYRFQLRAGVFLDLTLPADLEQDDVERLHRWLRTLPDEPPPQNAERQLIAAYFEAWAANVRSATTEQLAGAFSWQGLARALELDLEAVALTLEAAAERVRSGPLTWEQNDGE